MEFEAAGLNVRQRGRRTDECLDALRSLWSGDEVSFSGRHFAFEKCSLNPPPTQEPHPPIWGGRPAGCSDAPSGTVWRWLVSYFYSPERYRDSVAKITAMAEEEDRDLSMFQWRTFRTFPSIPRNKRLPRPPQRLSAAGIYMAGTSLTLFAIIACWVRPKCASADWRNTLKPEPGT